MKTLAVSVCHCMMTMNFIQRRLGFAALIVKVTCAMYVCAILPAITRWNALSAIQGLISIAMLRACHSVIKIQCDQQFMA